MPGCGRGAGSILHRDKQEEEALVREEGQSLQVIFPKPEVGLRRAKLYGHSGDTTKPRKTLLLF